MKMKSYRFSDETIKKITELAINEAILQGEQVSNTDLIRRLINEAYYKLTKRKGK